MSKVPKGKAPAVICINPKFPHNIGTALRACSCWGIEQLWWTGKRVTLDIEKGERLPREERMRGYKDVEFYNHDRPFDAFDHLPNVTPVAVELKENSEILTTFDHPENAVYVFGPEDGSIPQTVMRHCHRFVAIPTHHCLNLAAAINVVLYDRRIKRQLAGLEDIVPVKMMLKEERGAIRSMEDDSWQIMEKRNYS